MKVCDNNHNAIAYNGGECPLCSERELWERMVSNMEKFLKNNRHDLENKVAAALAHRACCGTEHDPENGKLHGYCVVCGVEWPCETAKMFLKY